MKQVELFSAANPACTFKIPTPPALEPHYEWPYPGLSPEDSARASVASSALYMDLLITLVKQHGGPMLTDSQLLALVPEAWRALLGPWTHACLCPRLVEPHGIEVSQVVHDGGGDGFHWVYRVTDSLAD